MNGTVRGIGLSGSASVQRAVAGIMYQSLALLPGTAAALAKGKIMNWIPKNGQWWRKAVAKAGGDADRMPIRPEEQDRQLANLRLHKAIAATEIFKCRALMAVRTMNGKA